MRILLVEDDAMIGESLLHALGLSGYRVDWAKDAETAELGLADSLYDLVLLDLGLPKKTGLDILRGLRRAGNHVPVLILTARDAVADRVGGLDAGADDYLVKPFDLNELEARIRALIRRHGGRGVPVVEAGGMTLNPATRELQAGGNTHILGAREYALMHCLMRHPGNIYSVADLEEHLYGWSEEVESNAVEVHIYQLRKKLGKGCIVNLRGVGYRIGAI